MRCRRLLSYLLTAALILGVSRFAYAAPLDPSSYSSLGTLDLASGTVTFDTDTVTVSGAFSGLGTIQSQGAGLPDIAVFTFSNINIASGVNVRVIGSRPLALLSHTNVNLHSIGIAAGMAGGNAGGFAGPGGGLGGGGTGIGSAGGGGGGFGGLGGAGGGGGSNGGIAYGSLITGLQGGSGGGSGTQSAGGAGGGALEIGAVGNVAISGTISVFARPGADAECTAFSGVGCDTASGGGGGGSGGAVLIHGQTVTGPGLVSARGGLGGRGSDTTLTPAGGGGGGGGGRVQVQTDALTIGSAYLGAQVQGAGGGFAVAGGPGTPGDNGVAQVTTALTILPSGIARQLGSDGTFAETLPGFQPFQTSDLQVNAGGVAFATSSVASAHNVSLQGGFVSAGLGWNSTGGAQIAGFGHLTGAFSGGMTNSVVASGGVLTLGDANSAAGFAFAGTIGVASGATLELHDANQAQLGSSTVLSSGARMTSLNGALLGAGRTLAAVSNAIIEGSFTNQGLVNGPSEAGQFLTFADGVNGSGDYTGNIEFAGGFSPGNSPGLVTFAGSTVFLATSPTTMELGGLYPGTGHDKIVVEGLLTLEGGVLDVRYWDGFTASAGNVFDLFDWGALYGAFGDVYLPTLESGLTWDVSRLYVDGSISVNAPIPEPETYVLLLAGLAVLGFVARRRSKIAA